jgi:hypothetical protein
MTTIPVRFRVLSTDYGHGEKDVVIEEDLLGDRKGKMLRRIPLPL